MFVCKYKLNDGYTLSQNFMVDFGINIQILRWLYKSE